VNSEWFAEHNEVEEVLNDFSAQFTTEDLAALSLEVDVERADPAEVAEEYLTEKGLI
jgi:osmoprotectant transport system permease protein